MKGHKAHHHKHPRAEHAKGGKVFGNEAKGDDIKDESPSDVYAGANSKVAKEARERKRGGKAVGKVHGAAAKHHAGRKPRKSGGKVGSDTRPLTSAHKGVAPSGHSDIEID